MALAKGDLSLLLRQLRGAGPLERVRLLAQSIAALRGLSPWDRKVLLRMAGFEGAEALVERLTGDDRRTGQALTRLLGELERRPEELDRTVRALADPRHRGEAVDALLESLDRALVEPPPPPAAPAAPAAEGPWRDPLAAAPAPGAQPQGAPSPRTAAPPATPPPARPPEPARRAKRPEPPARPAPVPPQGPRAPSRPAPPITPEPALVAEPIPAPAVPAPAPTTLPAARERGPAVGALAALLDLQHRLGSGETPTAAQLRDLLEAEVPFPWARRRAIQRWLESAPSGNVDAPLALIAELATPGDRTWCLATLAGIRPWDGADWGKIVAAAPTEAARRRLEHRRRPAREAGRRARS